MDYMINISVEGAEGSVTYIRKKPEEIIQLENGIYNEINGRCRVNLLRGPNLDEIVGRLKSKIKIEGVCYGGKSQE